MGGTLIFSICTGWADFFWFIFFFLFCSLREGLFFVLMKSTLTHHIHDRNIFQDMINFQIFLWNT